MAPLPPRSHQPPRSRRTTRASISYREESSDADLSDSSATLAIVEPARFSRRLRNHRRTSSLGSSSESEVESPPRHRAAVAYSFSASQPRATSAHPRKRPATQITPATTNATFSPFKKRKLVVAESAIDQSAEGSTRTSPSSRKVPAWQSLEYQILFQTFKYAALPLYENASQARPSIHWLLDTSLLSRSFHDAAIAALLQSPPLYPSFRTRGLLRLLNQPQHLLSTNYRTKIKRLDIEVKHMLMKKSAISLTELVRCTPLLQELRLYHNHDHVGAVWAQPAVSKKNWAYPAELFDALDESKIQLKGFEWNGRFPDTQHLLPQMESMHSRSSLQSLQSLSLMNLLIPEKLPDQHRDEWVRHLTASLAGLSELVALKFQNCDIISRDVLASLPQHLRSLSLIKCGSFTSQDLEAGLDMHGYHLTELVLDSNQAMDLGFIPNLAVLCPQLETFKVDLTYTDVSSYHDIEPHYDDLLPNGQPTWPKTLRSIDLANLRNLDADEADHFFASLVKAAPNLQDLRRLSVKAILKFGWRDRANLRQKWKARFEEVFHRKSQSPKLASTFPHRSICEVSQPAYVSARTTSQRSCTLSDTSRSASPAPLKRKSARIARSELKGLQTPSETDGPDQKEKSRGKLPLQSTDFFVQGMCDEVTFRIDDQRPADSQFNEADFLDEELSGDEEWTGQDPVAMSAYAW